MRTGLNYPKHQIYFYIETIAEISFFESPDDSSILAEEKLMNESCVLLCIWNMILGELNLPKVHIRVISLENQTEIFSKVGAGFFGSFFNRRCHKC